MKKIIFLIFAIVFVVAIQSCKKDEQPRYIKVEILPRTGSKIVQMEDLIDRNRATMNPSSYDSLANYCTNEVMVVLLSELKPDSGIANSGDIAKVVGEYDKFWRGNHPKHQSKVWARLNVGVQKDVFRTCTRYSKKFLSRLKDYCEGVVNGSPDWTAGVRVEWLETEIQRLFIYDPDPSVVWQYRDELWSYLKNFAANPNNKAKYEKDGFMNFGWGN